MEMSTSTRDEGALGSRNVPWQRVAHQYSHSLIFLSGNRNSRMISSLFVLLENDKTLYTACLFIAIIAHIISSHGKTQGSVCQEQKSPKRSCCRELLIASGWKKFLSSRTSCGVCPRQCTYQKLKICISGKEKSEPIHQLFHNRFKNTNLQGHLHKACNTICSTHSRTPNT